MPPKARVPNPPEIDSEDYSVEDDLSADQLDEQLEHHEARGSKTQRTAATEPLLTTLFKQVISEMDDVEDQQILFDFASHVLTPLTDVFGMDSAKGGDVAREQETAYATRGDREMRNPEDFWRDQTLRSHLLNGMLPAFRIAGQLQQWNAPALRSWHEETKRLFIAGFMLHDYAKSQIGERKLAEASIPYWQALDKSRIPVVEKIFVELCEVLGLDAFLQPLGGARLYIQDLIYIAYNTQQFKQTAHLPDLLPNKHTSSDVFMLAANVSWLADLITYVARTPRDVVAHNSLNKKALYALTLDPRLPGMLVARLTYHHVAENRGVLLNFIHEAARTALSNEARIPLLFAPSGIVYLERYDAPPPPTPDALIAQVVSDIRQKATAQLLESGKGARRGNVNLQIDDSYRDYFDLPAIIRRSVQIVQRHIRSNKSADRLEKVTRNNLPGSDNLPPQPSGKTDARLDQIAEWAGFLEVQLRERLSDQLDLAGWLLPRLGIEDLSAEFTALRDHPDASRLGGGIKLWWFWAAAHVLDRQALNEYETLDLIARLSNELADALPTELPPSARVDETKWNDLADYLARMLTIGGTKTGAWAATEEPTRYINAKKRGGGAVCAMCGDVYNATKPNETAVAFQPGVYTSRVKIGSSSNARSLCSICALEQLLRQLFVNNLDSGRNVEDQRVRYLSLYPSYFFTPETLTVLRRLYFQMKDTRLGAGDLRKVINSALIDPALVTAFLTDQAYTPTLSASLWTRLAPFMLQQADDQPSKRVLRYSNAVGGTFFMFGLRLFDAKTDIEAWILPTFVSFVLTVALDLKVVISEGSVAMITESDELPETLWFDAAHPAIRAVLDIGRKASLDRLHVDEVLPALTRLAIAYLIHLDTEFNGRDEQWQRFPPLAHALAESPLYVFHYLIKQERDDSEHKAPTRERTLRYLSYALLIADEKGKQAMSIARDLVNTYRGFYRADNFKNSNSILRPVNVVADALLNAAVLPAFKDPEALFEVAYGELYKFMDRVGKGLADGRFPKGVSAAERDEAMRAFCRLFVNDLFIRDFNRDAAALRGKPVNLLKNACEVIYRELQYAEWGGRDTEDAADADTAE